MISFCNLLCLAVVGFHYEALALIPPALPQHLPLSVSRVTGPWSSTKKPIEKDDNEESESKEPASFKDKLAELDGTIAAVEVERQKLLQAELVRYDKKGDKEGESRNLVPVEEWTQRELMQPPPISIQPAPSSSPNKPRSMTTRSKVTRSDAGTLVIEITPQGISSGVLFNGAFSVAWFSAIVPATFAALSGGILTGLFLLPFWAAGGMVAKQAVVDPFVSNKLSIGQYAWCVESLYANNKFQKKEGATADLQGAKVEVPVVVNNVPQHQLCLYDSRKGVTGLGQGLPSEELEKVAKEINEYLAGLPTNENGKETNMSWGS